jgi:hypothetical protein
MRDILKGPFGSMGSMNVKLRNICIEDLILESFFACLSLLRIRIATTVYELWGACASLLGTSLIAAVTLILVVDGGLQCWCCSKKPVLKNFINFSCIEDKTLMLAYLFIRLPHVYSIDLTITFCSPFAQFFSSATLV